MIHVDIDDRFRVGNLQRAGKTMFTNCVSDTKLTRVLNMKWRGHGTVSLLTVSRDVTL